MSERCIWEDCDQQAVYCEGHAHEFVDPLQRLDKFAALERDLAASQARVARLEEALRELMGLAEREGWIHVAINNARAALGETKEQPEMVFGIDPGGQDYGCEAHFQREEDGSLRLTGVESTERRREGEKP